MRKIFDLISIIFGGEIKGMIIYNVTIKIEWSVADEWLKWMKEIHIPDILLTNCFEKYQFVRLLQVDETEGPTYAVQYFCALLSKYDFYLQHYAPQFRKEAANKWGEKYIDFSTLMQVVE